jgi:hypothetical protein
MASVGVMPFDLFQGQAAASPTISPRRSILLRQFSQIKFGGWWASRVHPLDDHGPSCAVFVVLQIPADRFYHCPSVFYVDTQHRIEELSAQDRFDILLDAHGRAVFAIAGYATGSDHSPESFFLHEEAGLIRKCVSDSVMLVAGMHHDVRTVKRRTFGIVIEERTASSENIPRIVDVKIHQAQSQGEVDSGHCTGIIINGDELTLREDLSVVFKFVKRVGFLRGV